MADLEKLEKDVGEKRVVKPTRMYTFALLTLGVGLIATGIFLSGSGLTITADTEPPRPGDPTRLTPPTPEIPTRDNEFPPVPPGPNEFAFGSGWSMISGEDLYGYDLTEFRNAGLALYSFNDPKYANRDFAVVFGDATQCQTEKIGCDVIYPQPSLGYYVYNSKSSEVKVTLQPSEAPDLSSNIFGRGWHVMYWGGEAITEQDLLDQITLTYSDGKTLTAKQAIASTEHKISMKIYGVVDETTIDPALAIRELGSANSATEITTIPQDGYFWIYLRRTAKRVTAISVNDSYVSVVESEEAQIDAWIVSNNLNDCGDAQGTMYTGGSCLFNESTGQYRDKYEVIISKFPDKPWLN